MPTFSVNYSSWVNQLMNQRPIAPPPPPSVSITYNTFVNPTPVTPTAIPTIEANALYGKPMSLFAGGYARIGSAAAPIVFPTINSGLASGIWSFGVPANPAGTRLIFKMYLDNELAWTCPAGSAFAEDGTFTAETFNFVFRTGRLNQEVLDLEEELFPGMGNAYRPQMLLQIRNLPTARFQEKTGKPIPYIALEIGDVTDGADPFDGINLGTALERIAHSPWAGYTSSTFEVVGITDVIDGILIKDNFTVVDLGQNTTRIYRNLDLLQSDKLYIKDRGTVVVPDIVFTRDNIVGGPSAITITRTDASSIPRELELLTVDPDQDYTIVPSLSKRARDPFVISAAAGKNTITLPIIMNANTRQAMVTFAHTADEVARKKISFQAMAYGYEVEPGDLIGMVVDVDGIDNEIYKVIETDHGPNLVVGIQAEAILRCTLFAGEGSDPYFSYTILQLSGRGSNGSTIFTDESYVQMGNATVHGNAQVTTSSPMFGQGWIEFDGSGDQVEFSDTDTGGGFIYGTVIFTIEVWLNPDTWGGGGTLRFLACQWESVGNLAWVLYCDGDVPKWTVTENGTAQFTDMTSSTPLGTGAPQHLAVSFDGTTYRMFVDGAIVATSTTIRNIFDSANDVGVGANSGSSSFFYDGKLRIRVLRGIAIYTAAFTPPTTAWATF